MTEALNGSFKAELIEHQGPWRDADQVERAAVQWVDWYNTEDLDIHQTLLAEVAGTVAFPIEGEFSPDEPADPHAQVNPFG
ncbi:hypothetical protein [Streptomyces halobius]|uniref:Integrase-like protein n=1 Tax=Streptomyces halobius TaxID=2879846 RepID=A0ABY4M0A2_9ACTN|nr:hypothetical protein [Streptomyces halobius]UQA90553.1 hypothetical protein K9S39_00305 [Streptomyces halobius]